MSRGGGGGREQRTKTILMVEQNAREGLASAHRGYVLELGKEKFEGTAKELLDSPEMAKLYLGGSTDGESYHRRSKMTATPVQ
jgi:ABC-type lipopolysaccharide export system ATPase subunit